MGGSDDRIIAAGVNNIRIWKIEAANKRTSVVNVSMGSIRRTVTCIGVCPMQSAGVQPPSTANSDSLNAELPSPRFCLCCTTTGDVIEVYM